MTCTIVGVLTVLALVLLQFVATPNTEGTRAGTTRPVAIIPGAMGLTLLVGGAAGRRACLTRSGSRTSATARP